MAVMAWRRGFDASLPHHKSPDGPGSVACLKPTVVVRFQSRPPPKKLTLYYRPPQRFDIALLPSSTFYIALPPGPLEALPSGNYKGLQSVPLETKPLPRQPNFPTHYNPNGNLKFPIPLPSHLGKFPNPLQPHVEKFPKRLPGKKWRNFLSQRLQGKKAFIFPPARPTDPHIRTPTEALGTSKKKKVSPFRPIDTPTDWDDRPTDWDGTE